MNPKIDKNGVLGLKAAIRETSQRRDSRMGESDYEDDDMNEDPEEYTDVEDMWMQECTEDSPEQSSQPARPTYKYHYFRVGQISSFGHL